MDVLANTRPRKAAARRFYIYIGAPVLGSSNVPGIPLYQAQAPIKDMAATVGLRL
jgi:hypothetical protein